MRVVSDLASFMPRGGSSELAALSRSLTDSELTRSMVLTVGSSDLDAAVRAVRKLGDALQEHPEVAWLRAGANPEQLEAAYAAFFPRRHYLAASDAQALASRLDDAGLRASAQRLRAELARPSGGLVARIAAEDPLLAFPALLERLTAIDRRLTLRDGIFVTREGGHAVLLLGTHRSAFDSAHQKPLLEEIARQFAAIQSAETAPLTLESAGLNRFAVDIEDSIRGEIPLLFTVSTVGVALLFMLCFGSLRTLFHGMLPHMLGVLTAATFGLVVFGHLNGLAIAFGVSLIGVSIDYAIHLLNHHGFAPPGTPGQHTLRRLRPSLLLGGATTLASLVGLAFADFPGFDQMGVLATVGVSTALAVSLFVLPDLLGTRQAPPVARQLAEGFGRRFDGLIRLRPWLIAVPVLALVAGVLGLPRITWIDDLQALTTLDPGLRAEEQRVRSRITGFDTRRLLVARGASLEEALVHNDALHGVLETLLAEGVVAGFRSLHPFLRSEQLQRQLLTTLRADPSLPERLDRIYQQAGFRPGAFADFGASLADTSVAPLRHEDLRAAGLDALVRSMILDLGDEQAVVTYLEGIEDPARLEAALALVPGVQLFDQGRFFREVYEEYRARILQVVASGFFAVLGLLLLRYRKLRPALAAFLPSLLVAGFLAGLAALFQLEASILHLIGLILVLGMGVDYGVFMVDSRSSPEALGTTLVSLLLSCITTIFVFGVMGFSAHPALHAIGRTAGVGIALAFVLAPVALVLVGPERDGDVSPL
jgi:predicted exporter